MKKICIVTVLLAILVGLSCSVALAAAEGAAPAAPAQGMDSQAKGMIALATGIGLGIAALGGALGQGRAVASAVEGIGRNPGASGKIITPMIIGLAMIESLVIYSLVISFFLYAKL